MERRSLTYRQWISLGIASALLAVFGLVLVGLGAFFLFYVDSGRTTGVPGLVLGLVCLAIYLAAWVALVISIHHLWSFRAEDPRGFRIARFWLVVILGIGVSGLSWGWLDHEREMAVFRGDLVRYRQFSRFVNREALNEDLWHAARWGHVHLVRHLIERGADPKARLAGNGPTILEAARENLGGRPEGNRETIECLRGAGVVD